MRNHSVSRGRMPSPASIIKGTVVPAAMWRGEGRGRSISWETIKTSMRRQDVGVDQSPRAAGDVAEFQIRCEGRVDDLVTNSTWG